jgi:hypothetical protein
VQNLVLEGTSWKWRVNLMASAPSRFLLLDLGVLTRAPICRPFGRRSRTFSSMTMEVRLASRRSLSHC